MTTVGVKQKLSAIFSVDLVGFKYISWKRMKKLLFSQLGSFLTDLPYEPHKIYASNVFIFEASTVVSCGYLTGQKLRTYSETIVHLNERVDENGLY